MYRRGCANEGFPDMLILTKFFHERWTYKNSTNSGFFVLYISAYQSTQSEVGGLFLFSET